MRKVMDLKIIQNTYQIIIHEGWDAKKLSLALPNYDRSERHTVQVK